MFTVPVRFGRSHCRFSTGLRWAGLAGMLALLLSSATVTTAQAPLTAKVATPQVTSESGKTPAVASSLDSETRLSAAARQFFAQGLAFADKGDWSEAVDRFRRARAIRKSSVIAFNLAASLSELHQLVEASELLHAIESDPELDPALLNAAGALLARIQPRLASLTVHVDPALGADREVRLDGALLSPVELGAPIPVDPVPHEVTLGRGARILQRHPVVSEAGGNTELRIAVKVPSPAEVAALARARADAEARVADGPITERWWFWAGVGTVVAGVVTAISIATLSGAGQRAPDIAMP